MRARLAELEDQKAALTCLLVDKDRRRVYVEPLRPPVQPPISLGIGAPRVSSEAAACPSRRARSTASTPCPTSTLQLTHSSFILHDIRYPVPYGLMRKWAGRAASSCRASCPWRSQRR